MTPKETEFEREARWWEDYMQTVRTLPRMGTGHVQAMFKIKEDVCADSFEPQCICGSSATYDAGAVWSKLMKVPQSELLTTKEVEDMYLG